jgi:hypothetical protein
MSQKRSPVPTVLVGAGRIIDLGGTFRQGRIDRELVVPRRADVHENLSRDWKVVGSDLARTVKKLKSA